uniref:Uncharacterized protein n=1 Tax=Anguilla anguilla TaxID=7936 RepID=A0A0E9QSN3_ANGAN
MTKQESRLWTLTNCPYYSICSVVSTSLLTPKTHAIYVAQMFSLALGLSVDRFRLQS